MIKVIIERLVSDGFSNEYEAAAKKILSVVQEAKGYLAGESWCENRDRDCRIIITYWSTTEAWLAWEASSEREKALHDLLPSLQQEERILVLEPHY